ncbi:MAG: hypothetical protein LBH44_03955, partial [Treponema sp.]|nr:hypothetical protein [Treponema sp.]
MNEDMGLDFQALPETTFSDTTAKQVREYFSKMVSNVDEFVEQFRMLSNDLLNDEKYMEQFTIEKIG